MSDTISIDQVAKALAESTPHVQNEWDTLPVHRKTLWRARATAVLAVVNPEMERLRTENTVLRGVLNRLRTEGSVPVRDIEDALEETR
ncbi:hypothetical protein [Prescottella equi]